MLEPRHVLALRLTGQMKMDDTHVVTCPYCGEEIEIYVEPDVRGSYVQDCECAASVDGAGPP